MKKRYLKPGEFFAVRKQLVQYDPDRKAFFWLFADPVYDNERIGSICVVRVNGPLDYHEGFGDSYESIVKRIECGLDGDFEDGDRDASQNDIEAAIGGPPSCLVLRMDCPGGVVAGLEQTVNKIRRMSKEKGIPIYAYVDEMAYSAGYALCCACDEVYLPNSGFLGSIGVISTLVDQTAADKKDGLKFVVITSGKRKADGHPHVPITDEMIDEERPRNEKLAQDFFKMVRRARGVPIDTIQGWEAARFMGKEAVEAGLADGVVSWDGFIRMLQDTYDEAEPMAGVKNTNDDIGLAQSPNPMPKLPPTAKPKKSTPK
jgi:ClpP class serine protease